jgi:hypothetical protein
MMNYIDFIIGFITIYYLVTISQKDTFLCEYLLEGLKIIIPFTKTEVEKLEK